MSGQSAGNAGSSAPRPTGSAATNGGLTMAAQSRSNDSGLGSGAGNSGQGGSMSAQNLNQIVSKCTLFLTTFFHI
jgi:hypothetical protein